MEKKKIDIVVMFFETLILEDKIIHIGQIWRIHDSGMNLRNILNSS